MDDLSLAYEWAKSYPFDDEQLHYMTILALKILDGQCKMDYHSYNLFMSIYDGILDKNLSPLDLSVHEIIELSRSDDPIVPKKEYKEVIHELRTIMMKNMEKSTMKAFKKFVREHLDLL
ncbi:hypothetical protein KKC13_03090 [bacterium]|nr:hypothetical protein [bacterium]MBU1958043.1 hypothetical protein [bacterium]